MSLEKEIIEELRRTSQKILMKAFNLLKDPNITKEDFDYLKTIVTDDKIKIEVIYGNHKYHNQFNSINGMNSLSFETHEDYMNYLNLMNL